jgi:hypothetical protein
MSATAITLGLVRAEIEAPLKARIAELEAALRSIYSAAYDPEGATDTDIRFTVIEKAGEALGLRTN